MFKSNNYVSVRKGNIHILRYLKGNLSRKQSRNCKIKVI